MQAYGYDCIPTIETGCTADSCTLGWAEISQRISCHVRSDACRIVVECYPGVDVDRLASELARRLNPDQVIRSEVGFWPAPELRHRLHHVLTDDPVFGRLNCVEIEDFFLPAELDRLRVQAAQARGFILIIGVGASLIEPAPSLLVYADLSRWEIQLRQRAGRIPNVGADNATADPLAKYKRAFFVDWRAADRLKQRLWFKIDFLLDTHLSEMPKLVGGMELRRALGRIARQPFRVRPFFDPGPWGGQWMKRHFHLPTSEDNYAWGFDCVPEENSLLLGFSGQVLEIPALDLVWQEPLALLGESVYRLFGAEFPIRFDFLDTMQGGNLSLQVHPLREYIWKNFRIPYTQDESYYLVQAAPDAVVYLGLREGIQPSAMQAALTRAQAGGQAFPAEHYVNTWPARRHDHFSIPAGTVHAAGRNCLVLEISATPYLFTFKLWDWGRLGLNGQPRALHLDHGMANIQWERSTGWVERELMHLRRDCGVGNGWREESTGLHRLEFIETRRHWFTHPVLHDTCGTLNVLNLVQGERVLVESPTGAFPPWKLHFAETLIVPAAVGKYCIRPLGRSVRELATIKAWVRPGIG